MLRMVWIARIRASHRGSIPFRVWHPFKQNETVEFGTFNPVWRVTRPRCLPSSRSEVCVGDNSSETFEEQTVRFLFPVRNTRSYS